MDRHRFDAHRILLAEAVTDAGLDIVLSAIQGFGNGVSAEHRLALRDLQAGFSSQAFINPGRIAYALPCGGGKTLSVIAWITASHRLAPDVSVAVSVAQIAALCDIKRQLIENGVPEELIGLRHSHGLKAGFRDTGASDRPIMLLSHSRLRRGSESELFTQHKGMARTLLFWDETLIPFEAESLSWLDVRFACKRVLEELNPSDPLALAAAQASATFTAEFDRQRTGLPPSTVILFQGQDREALAHKARHRAASGTEAGRAAYRSLEALFRLSQSPVSLAITGNGASGDGVIRYTVAVDPDLANIAVLDASYPVRTLAHTGQVKEGTTPAMRSFKTYDRVAVRELKLATGRTTLISNPESMKSMVAAVAHVIRAVPDSESILIFSFKGDNKKTLQTNLLRSLEKEGVDLRAEVNGRARISSLTWGNECSLNEYSHCKHVILAGVLRRHPLDLAASLTGKYDDLAYRAGTGELKAVEHAEAAHCVLQAMNRGACRTIDDTGRAGAMTLTIVANVSGLHETLAPVLPGIDWSVELPERKPSRTWQVENAILNVLADTSPTVEKITCRLLKARAQAIVGGHISSDVWTNALRKALLLTLAPSMQRWEKIKGAAQVVRHVR